MEDFFRIARGLEINEKVTYLEGVGSPGSGDSGNAQVGSVYTDTLNGELWTKITVGVGVQHWSKMASENWVNNNTSGTVSWREPVAVIDTTTTVLPTGAASTVIDGVTLVDGARVLFSGLTPEVPNVYIYDLTNEEFTQDINSLSQGDTIYVDSGTSGGTRWTWNGTAWVRFDSASVDELGYVRAYDGKPAAGSIMPVYSSSFVITQGSSLTNAIGELDSELGAGVSSGNFISAADSLSINLQSIDTELGANVVDGNYILAASKMNANIQSLDTAIGTPTGTGFWISNTQKVNGNLLALDTEIGENVANGNSILANNSINQNIQALDTQIGADVTTGSIVVNTYSANQNIQALDSKIGSVTDGNQVLSSSTISANINILDSFVGGDLLTGTYVLNTNSLSENIQAIDVALGEISKESLALSVTTSTVVDAILASVVKWIVKVVDSANPDNVQAFEIFAASNGLTVDYTRFAVLKLGANISGLAVNVGLSGSNIQLIISCPSSVNVTVRRVSSI